MDTTHCINNNTWELYAANKLADKELDALQKHTKTCDLCNDIKEGIDAMPKPELLGERVTSLNKQVDTYLAQKKSKRIPLWYWSAAAVLLISLGIGFIYTRTNTNDVALNIPENKTEQTTIDTLEKRSITNKEKENTNTPRIKVKRNKKENGEGETKEQTPKNNEELRANDGKNAGFKTDESINPTGGDNKDISTDDLNKEKRVIVELPTIEKAQKTIEVTKDVSRAAKKQKLELPSPQMNNIFNNSYNGNLGLNNFDFKQPLDSLNYNTALEAFANDSLNKCITSLSYILQDVNSKFYEDGLLLQAKALIKQNKNKEAKTTLKKAITLKGKRKREAKKLLRKLK